MVQLVPQPCVASVQPEPLADGQHGVQQHGPEREQADKEYDLAHFDSAQLASNRCLGTTATSSGGMPVVK